MIVPGAARATRRVSPPIFVLDGGMIYPFSILFLEVICIFVQIKYFYSKMQQFFIIFDILILHMIFKYWNKTVN